MAYSIVTVKNTNAGSVGIDTVNGMVTLDYNESATVTLTASQLAAVVATTGLSITAGNSANTSTTILGLVKENDGNVDVFSQATLDGNFDKIEDFAAKVSSALDGDIVMAITPTTAGSSAATVNAGSFTKTVHVALKNAAGAIHTWCNAALAAAVVATTVGDGDASIADATPNLVKGEVDIVITYTGTWAADDTCVLTLSNATILGFTVTGGTFTDTIVA